jgi:hypothetical protein
MVKARINFQRRPLMILDESIAEAPMGTIWSSSSILVQKLNAL